MKTKTLKQYVLLTLVLASFQVIAKDHNDNRGGGNDKDDKYDYAYYIMSPKSWHQDNHNNDDDKWLRIFSKAGVVKTVSFKGSLKIPQTLRVNSGLLRNGKSEALLILDNRIQCSYQATLTKKFFNAMYGLVSCNDGSRANSEVRVESKVGIYLKDIKGTPSTVYAALEITESYAKGIQLPQLEASKGQILRFDGELWVPSNYIPDGQTSGDVLVWDGSAWMASKLGAGSQGPQGEQGLQGPQGIQGAQGVQGPQGDQGPQGLIGPAGANGLAGAKGDKGDTGLQGPAGVQGSAGLQGPQGIAGVAGAAGAKGDKGDKGDQGDAGLVNLIAGNGILGGTISGNGGTIAVNTGTAAGQIPVIDSTGRLPASILPENSAVQKIAFIKDVKASGTHGGACDLTKGWEQIRDLNSVSGDASFLNLANNQVTLSAGTYVIEAQAPAYLDGFHKAVLVDAATGSIVLVGSNARSHNVAGGMEPSVIMGQVVLTAPTSFIIKHRCSQSMAMMGFGTAINFGVDEVYTQMKITKLK